MTFRNSNTDEEPGTIVRSPAITYANHNLNKIKQMSMLKVKCDFDSGDCCPNETFSDIWDTYCNDCQCLE